MLKYIPGRAIFIPILLIFLLSGFTSYSQTGYHFDGTVGAYEKSLTGKGFGTENDVTSELQALIDSVTAQPEGGTIVLSGEIQLKTVDLRSNVHINILKGTVIKGTLGKTKPAMFDLAVDSDDNIENVKFYCGDCDPSAPVDDESEKYIFDVTDYPVSEGFRAFMLGNITNFWISDFYVRDNWTRFSAITLNPVMRGTTTDKTLPKPLWDWEVIASPFKGDILNAHTNNAHTGYGLIQVQSARDVYFEKISGIGGVTLRLESGAGIANVPTHVGMEYGVIKGIRAKNVILTNGFSTVTLSPHGRINEDVYLEDIRSVSAAFAIKIATGFFDGSLMIDEGGNKVLIDPEKFFKGRFDGPVIVKNVHSVFGLNANGRYGQEYLYVEKSLREAHPWESLPYSIGTTKSRIIPAIMAVGYKSIPNKGSVPDTIEGEYLAQIDGLLTSEGFPACLDTIYGNLLYEDDKEKMDCSQFEQDTTGTTEPVDTTGTTEPIDTSGTTEPVDTIGTYITNFSSEQILYPNPAGSYIYIRHLPESDIRIYSSSGILVRNFSSHSRVISNVNIANLPQGIYLVQIRNNAGITSKRFIRKS